VLIQYAAMAEMGVIPREELKKLKTLDSYLQGHPDMDRTPGIEAVTGSLGMGLSIGLGMALGFRLDRRPNHVYVIMGDGELSEGQIWEAAMATAAFKIDNLTGIVDLNRIQATGPTREILDNPDVAAKWKAFGWEVLSVNGHDVAQILAALDKARQVVGRPTVIVAETVKGKGFSLPKTTPPSITACSPPTSIARPSPSWRPDGLNWPTDTKGRFDRDDTASEHA